MKIATILGSLNKNGSCAHALNIVNDELQKSENIELVTVKPNDYTLPFPGQSLPNSDEKKLIVSRNHVFNTAIREWEWMQVNRGRYG